MVLTVLFPQEFILPCFNLICGGALGDAIIVSCGFDGFVLSARVSRLGPEFLVLKIGIDWILQIVVALQKAYRWSS